DYGTMVLDIPAGRQHMDGETALRYARTRHQDSDFGRMERQQQVMVALRTRLLSPLNWWRLPAVLAAVRQATRTDLGLTDLPTLALAFGRDGSSPERLTLDLTLTEEFRGGGGAFLLRARPELKQRVAVLLNPASAGVEVLNGSGVEGRARQAAETLRSRDVRVVNIGDAPRQQASTTVEVCPGCKRAGALAASVLGLPSEAVQENALLPDGIDVRVTLGGTGAPAAGR
ncbi:MAG: LCP family protein, partial [Chloroflexota bacterium]